MKSVDIAKLGNILNMKNVFALYLYELLQLDKTARMRIKELRDKLMFVIEHYHQKEINSLMQQLVKRTNGYSVLTRYDLVSALKRAKPFGVLAAFALYEDEGNEACMLHLLDPKPTHYRGKPLLIRFGFTNPLKPR